MRETDPTSRDQILDAAERLFAGRGFARAPTTRDAGASVLGTIAGATTAAEREEVRNILLAGLALLDREAPQRSARVVWF